MNPFVFLLGIYNIYLKINALFHRNAEFWLPSCTLPFSSSIIIFWGLVCWVLFFSRSILFCTDLCSADLSLRKLWAPLEQPFNLKFPGSQSPWELQYFHFCCSFNSVASSCSCFHLSRSTSRLPLEVGGDGVEAQHCSWGCSYGIGINYSKMRHRNFTFWCTVGK